jgi:DNA segregation ATPase FtsK/SpoIIIE-like protein
LRTFGLNVQVAHLFEGYSSDTYLLEPGAGVKITSIVKYKMDIANALNVPAVTIDTNLYIHLGRAYVKIDAPKQGDKILNFSAEHIEGRRIPIGMDNFNNLVVWDLNNHATPHTLVCGATGSGKSVCIRSTIEAAKLMGVSDIVVFDPKYEFCHVDGIKVYNDIEEIEEKMAKLVEDMQAAAKGKYKKDVLIIFDEFADAVQTARSGKELEVREEVITGYYANGRPKKEKQVVRVDKSLEENLKILLQKGRSLGYRIMAATQRASVQVITGDAKVNFPVQICFRVPKALDSKVVLDEEGAEALSGAGDGLMRSPEYQNQLVRFQGFYYG